MTQDMTVKAKTVQELASEIISLEQKRAKLSEMESEAMRQIDRLTEQLKNENYRLLGQVFFVSINNITYLCKLEKNGARTGTLELTATPVTEIPTFPPNGGGE